mmetsp:Transcript_52164/g.138080  ORF Transcript_52164/g.138080 Transcript_52164/m.138080 type:complete len:215 (-) Transcript_52164:600-1244(-)
MSKPVQLAFELDPVPLPVAPLLLQHFQLPPQVADLPSGSAPLVVEAVALLRRRGGAGLDRLQPRVRVRQLRRLHSQFPQSVVVRRLQLLRPGRRRRRLVPEAPALVLEVLPFLLQAPHRTGQSRRFHPCLFQLSGCLLVGARSVVTERLLSRFGRCGELLLPAAELLGGGVEAGFELDYGGGLRVYLLLQPRRHMVLLPLQPLGLPRHTLLEGP